MSMVLRMLLWTVAVLAPGGLLLVPMLLASRPAASNAPAEARG